jgi:hypothetical protein
VKLFSITEPFSALALHREIEDLLRERMDIETKLFDHQKSNPPAVTIANRL